MRFTTEFWSIIRFSFQKKSVLRQIDTKYTTHSGKLRFTPVCVKKWLLPNFKLALTRNAFGYKLVQGMQDAPKNCVLIQFLLKTDFFATF